MQEHLNEVEANVEDMKIEDQVVENSNKEIEYLQQKHEELEGNLEGIDNEIASKKENCDFNKQSDLAAIV